MYPKNWEDLKMKTKAIKNGLTDDLLKELYLNGMTSEEIAKEYAMTGGGILYRLKKLGISRIANHERNRTRMVEKSGKDIFALSKEEFHFLLKEHGERHIAKEYGCSRQVMKSLREKFCLEAMSKTGRIHLKLEGWFDEEQESILYGSMLGDANIHLGRNGTARYKETHSLKQKKYLEWKGSILGGYVSNRGVKQCFGKIWHDGREMYSVLLLSYYHVNFRKIYDWFYDENGVKHLPENFEEMINPLSAAVWYMDDGSLHGNKPTIASCFGDDDIVRICNAFKNKFGIDCVSVKNKKNCVTIIHFDRKQFFNLIGGFIIESMSYKVTLPERFSIKCISKPNLAKYCFCKSIVIDDNNIDELVDYCHIVGFPYPRIGDYDRNGIVYSIRNASLLINENGMVGNGVSVGNDFLLSCFSNYFESHSNGNWSSKWHFDNNLAFILRSLQKQEKYLVQETLRKELMKQNGIYGFRPIVAKQLYDRYCPENGIVLDPCGGWGGRMLGAYCSDNVKRYDCMDACDDTVYGLKHERMLMDRTVAGKEVNVSYGAYEDSTFGHSFYDVVFTSPPYFIKEFYSNDKFQAETRYGDDYKQWKDGFFLPFIEKSVMYLKCGGHFIVNIDNVRIGRKEYQLADDFLEMASGFRELEFVETLHMVHNDRFSGIIDSEPILVFRKRSNCNDK